MQVVRSLSQLTTAPSCHTCPYQGLIGMSGRAKQRAEPLRRQTCSHPLSPRPESLNLPLAPRLALNRRYLRVAAATLVSEQSLVVAAHCCTPRLLCAETRRRTSYEQQTWGLAAPGTQKGAAHIPAAAPGALVALGYVSGGNVRTLGGNSPRNTSKPAELRSRLRMLTQDAEPHSRSPRRRTQVQVLVGLRAGRAALQVE